MMAAYIAGFSRLASMAMGTLSGRQGMTLWYGLMGVRLVALFVADRPWVSLREDFVCNGSLSQFCWVSCFNAHFAYPMDTLWDFSYVLAILPVLWLYQLSPRIGLAKPPAAAVPPAPPVTARGGGWRAWMAVICATSLAAVEAGFLWIVVQVQLPIVLPTLFLCDSGPCHQAVECVLFARAEKLMALAILIFTSALNILVSLAYVVTACLAEKWNRT